jgi:TPR repeat protein
MYDVGTMYEAGHGVDTDADAARQWFQKAADHGDEDAKMRLQ